MYADPHYADPHSPAAKNPNYFSHGKKSEAILMMDARKAGLAQAEAI